MQSDAPSAPEDMSASLEDYLETIYLLAQDQGYARVKDIAAARDVKPASVSMALRKLSDMGFVRYERREYIALTPEGEVSARRVFARHRLLTRFFGEVLRMPPDVAGSQACSMEHMLTDEAMDRLVRFFEVAGSCTGLLEALKECADAMDEHERTGGKTGAKGTCKHCRLKRESSTTLGDLKPGQFGVVTQVVAKGALRQRLLDMGILPETELHVERVGFGGDPVWIRCQGSSLALRRAEARGILVRKEATP